MVLAERQICWNQWNRIKNPDTNSYIHIQPIFNKGAKSFQWAKGSLFKQWMSETILPTETLCQVQGKP